MTTRMGLEPTTSSVTGWRSKPTELPGQIDGDNRTRTCDSLLVRQVLYQLSYAPASVRQFPLHCSCHRSSSDKRYYTPGWAVCQPLFLIFLFFFLSAFTPKKNKKTNKGKWAIRDSNPGPTGYEPVALTNWANGPNLLQLDYYTIFNCFVNVFLQQSNKFLDFTL